MRMTGVLRFTIGALLVQAATGAIAQTIPSGIYAMPDSGYSIAVQPQGDNLSVNEAGKDRTYVKTGPGSYQYSSQITGATYELRYRDRGSVEAIKVGSGNAPTLLIRQGGPAPEIVAAPVAAPAAAPVAAPIVATPVAAAPGPAPASPHLAVAERYQSLALSDKKDVQSWAFCSAAALKRSMATQDDAEAYGREAARRLASISVDPDRNPCPDAIPEHLWPRPKAAEEEALKAANAAQVAAATRQREEIAAMRLKQAADQQAYEQARAEHQAALEKARQEQQAFAVQQAAYQAALAAQQRQTPPRRKSQ